MLVGQKVPFKKQYMPSEQEQANWQRIQTAIKNRVAAAYTVPEASSWYAATPTSGRGNVSRPGRPRLYRRHLARNHEGLGCD